jgi:chromosome segregation ATPase
LAFSQSATPATWESFDQLIANLKIEIDNLNSQIIEAQNSLTQSQSELATLKALFLEREQLLKKYADSLTQSKQSALTYEADLRASSRLNVILGIAAIIGGGAAVYFAVR